ncbi:MAG: PD40 domain-containing protein [Bacteroidales bacterium]|nr:PD40 domain-containing protein [Candidatus Cacconaster merdequi]
MKTKHILFIAILAVITASCGSGKEFLETYSPEEGGLNMMKITDENTNSILGASVGNVFSAREVSIKNMKFAFSTQGGSKASKFYWYAGRLLSLSPDGSEIAYLSRKDKQDNVMIKRSMAQGPSTQRTFRNVSDFCWGKDGNIYFADNSDNSHSQISSTNAHQGSLVRQMTSYNLDSNPVLSDDGSLLFFTRLDDNGPSIWSLELSTGALTSCARGYNPATIPGKNDSFVCVRNSSSGVSEIWIVNFVLGQETLLLTDKNRGFTNPSVSPDGNWLLCCGSSKSAASKTNNLDIFAVKMDGTNFAQMTYHPANDCSPAWSPDGKSIYFISDRANKSHYYNIWRMRFDY